MSRARQMPVTQKERPGTAPKSFNTGGKLRAGLLIKEGFAFYERTTYN